MIQLFYTSKATESVTPSLVLNILESARRQNTTNHVTGLLYCAQNQFAQCLEGDEAAVEAIFTRIACDPRHEQLRVFRNPINNDRSFTDWSMTFVDTSTAEVARVLLRNGLNTYEPTKWPEQAILPMLQSLGESLRAARIPTFL